MSLTAFVTGGTGFLGRRLVQRLVQSGVRLRCLVRNGSDLSVWNSRLTPEEQQRIELVRGDLSQPETIQEALHDVDVVYHLAAALGGSTSTMFLNTVLPTRHLLEASARANVGRFVLISSMGVYGTSTLKRWGMLDETTPIDPQPQLRDPYTFSKVRQEQIAWQAREQFGLPLVVIRPGVIYGPGRPVLTSRVGLPLGPAFIQMGGGQILPYTYVENCADAIHLAGTASDVEGEIFNIVDDDLPTGKRILQRVRKHGTRVRSLWIPRAAIGPLSTVYEMYSNWTEGQLPPVLTRYKCQAMWKPLRYSNNKAKQQLGWQPQISTDEGLNRALAQKF